LTKLKVSSTISDWYKEYSAIIDSGAVNTAIPKDDIIPSNATSSVFNLKYSCPFKTGGLNFDGFLDMYESRLLVGEEDDYANAHVIAAPMKWALIGREIMKLFRWEIDWKLREVKISRNL
jgi:hypothetical protein